MADGSSFSIELGVKGGGEAASAADAVANLASKLEIAGAAALSSSEAVKAGQAAYNQAEAAANRAALSVEKIGLAAAAQEGKVAKALEVGDLASATAAQNKLVALLARQDEAVAKATAATAAMNAEAAALDKLKSAAGAAADAEAKLSKQQAALESKTEAQTQADKAAADAQTKSVGTAGLLEGAFAKLGGPLGALGQKASGVGGAVLKMGKSLGAAGPYVAAAVLALAVAAAFVAATVAITRFAITSADAARTQALLSDGIAGSVAGGRKLDAKLDDLATKVPIARDELLGMAGDLAKTGLAGDELSAALEETAIKAAKLKFGPDFAKQLLSIDNQTARLKRSITTLFSGLKIEALLEGLSKIVDLFDKNSASANAIKAVFESLFQPVVDGLTAIIPKAIATFIQLEILALKALIMIKPYGAVLEAIGIGFLILGAIVAGIVVLFVAGFALMAGALALVLGGPWLLGDAFDSLGATIKESIGSAFDWFTAKVDAVMAFLSGISLSEIGTAMIDGLVAGILGAGPKVLGAITGIATGAISAAKNALGIASPSKVFEGIGANTAEGMAGGVDDGAPDVQSSMTSMVDPTAAAGAASGAAPAATAGGATYYVTVQGGGDAQSNVEAFRAWLASIGAQAGTAVPT